MKNNQITSRGIVAILAFIGTGSIIFLVIMARSKQYRSTFPPSRIRICAPRLSFPWIRNGLPSGAELFSLDSKHTFINNKSLCILFVHGNVGAVHKFPSEFRKAPCALALLEPRGFGHLYNSHLSYNGYIKDAIEAYSHLKQRYRWVIAVGHSLGGSAVMAIPNADHIVTINTFTSPHALAADEYPMLRAIGAIIMDSTLSPILDIQKRRKEGCRLTIYHAKHDKRILYHHGRRLADAGCALLHTVGNCHNEIGPQIQHLIRHFL